MATAACSSRPMLKRGNSGLLTPPSSPLDGYTTPHGHLQPPLKRPRVHRQDSFEDVDSHKTPPPASSRQLAQARQDEDIFSAPKNGRLYLGQGLPAQPATGKMTYVFRGKKVVMDVKPDPTETSVERELANIKPRLLFPSAIPEPEPLPALLMSPSKGLAPQTPKRGAAFGLIPPTPQSLPHNHRARPRKISSDSRSGDMMDIDEEEDQLIKVIPRDLFGVRERVRSETKLARRAGGIDTFR